MMVAGAIRHFQWKRNRPVAVLVAQRLPRSATVTARFAQLAGKDEGIPSNRVAVLVPAQRLAQALVALG